MKSTFFCCLPSAHYVGLVDVIIIFFFNPVVLLGIMVCVLQDYSDVVVSVVSSVALVVGFVLVAVVVSFLVSVSFAAVYVDFFVVFVAGVVVTGVILVGHGLVDVGVIVAVSASRNASQKVIIDCMLRHPRVLCAGHRIRCTALGDSKVSTIGASDNSTGLPTCAPDYLAQALA